MVRIQPKIFYPSFPFPSPLLSKESSDEETYTSPLSSVMPPPTFNNFQPKELQTLKNFIQESALQMESLQSVPQENRYEFLLEPIIAERLEAAQKSASEAKTDPTEEKNRAFIEKAQELARAIYHRLKNESEALPPLILDLTKAFLGHKAGLALGALDYAFKYIFVIEKFDQQAKLKNEISRLEKRLETLGETPEDLLEKERLQKILIKKKEGLFDLTVNFVYAVESHLQTFFGLVGEALDLSVAHGMFVKEQTISMIHTATTSLSLYTGVLGLGFTLYKLKLNKQTFSKIDLETKSKENLLKKHSEELSRDLIQLRLNQLQEQKESAYINTTSNMISVISTCLGITMGALTLAGITCPPVATLALGITIVSTVGYGGYFLYKNRLLVEQYAYQASSFVSSSASLTHELYHDLNRKIATLFHELTLSKSLKESVKITQKIENEFDLKERELTHQLETFIHEDVELTLEERDHREKMIEGLKQEIEALNEYKKSLLKGYQGLKNRAVALHKEQLSQLASQAEALAQRKLEEQERYNLRLQEYKDAASAALFRISLEKYRALKNDLLAALRPPKDPKELFDLLEEETPDPLSSANPEMIFGLLLREV